MTRNLDVMILRKAIYLGNVGGKTLYLIVYRDVFERIMTGEKTTEYREATEYWDKRIVGEWTESGWTKKDYDWLRITNGYGNDTRPYVLMRYGGYIREMKDDTQRYAIPITRSLWREYREEIGGNVTKC